MKKYLFLAAACLSFAFTACSDDNTQDEVGHVFAEVLADAGVYKLDEAGRAGFVRFLASVN